MRRSQASNSGPRRPPNRGKSRWASRNVSWTRSDGSSRALRPRPARARAARRRASRYDSSRRPRAWASPPRASRIRHLGPRLDVRHRVPPGPRGGGGAGFVTRPGRVAGPGPCQDRPAAGRRERHGVRRETIRRSPATARFPAAWARFRIAGSPDPIPSPKSTEAPRHDAARESPRVPPGRPPPPPPWPPPPGPRRPPGPCRSALPKTPTDKVTLGKTGIQVSLGRDGHREPRLGPGEQPDQARRQGVHQGRPPRPGPGPQPLRRRRPVRLARLPARGPEGRPARQLRDPDQDPRHRLRRPPRATWSGTGWSWAST